jgi:hypothetical protein
MLRELALIFLNPHSSVCIYSPKLTLSRVQLRTAVHILVRRVHQLSKVIVEANKEVPPLNPEDEGFLERVLGTLGLSDVPPYESSAIENSKTPGHLISKQQTFTPETSHSPSVGPPISAEATTSSPNVVLDAISADIQTRRSDFNDVARIMASMHDTTTTQPPGTNMSHSMNPGADHISPDWPFPTLDNMLNFDLFDPGDLSLHFLTEPPTDIPPTLHQEPAPARQIEQISRRQEDSTSDPGDEENTELVDQLSARLGSLRLAPDGKLWYCVKPPSDGQPK